MSDHLIIGNKKKKGVAESGAKVMPNVAPEVEKWGALVNWLRTKDYTPDMVRATILAYEKESECTGSESTSKPQD